MKLSFEIILSLIAIVSNIATVVAYYWKIQLKISVLSQQVEYIKKENQKESNDIESLKKDIHNLIVSSEVIKQLISHNNNDKNRNSFGG